MRPVTLPFVAVLAALSGAAVAQEAAAPSGPPPVLIINKEEIKPGRMGPHDKNAARFVARTFSSVAAAISHTVGKADYNKPAQTPQADKRFDWSRLTVILGYLFCHS